MLIVTQPVEIGISAFSAAFVPGADADVVGTGVGVLMLKLTLVMLLVTVGLS